MKKLVEKIIEIVGNKGLVGLNPYLLISEMSYDHSTSDVIEACQLCLEQGKIFLNSEGMVQKVEV